MKDFCDYQFNIPEYVRTVLNRLHANGERAYIVGGSLRDMLLNKAPHDFDLASSAEPLRVCEIFSDMRVIKTGLVHGTVTVLSDGQPIELTTFRVDGEYHDMRRPDNVTFTRRIEDDLSRRDFTVNAMAYNETDGLIDLFYGKDDLKNKIIRTVGNPYERFSEDALRIMRAFRFSAQLDFEIEKKTLEAAEALAERLSLIAKERIFSEFLRLICSPHPEKALKQMRDFHVLSYVLSDYIPSDRTIELLQSAQNDDLTRLALFFSDTDGDSARKELISLKASSRQRASSAITSAAKLSYSTREDMAKLRAQLSFDADIALRLSVLLGNSKEGALALLDDDTPFSISQLAISGNDLISLGYNGREIGKTLAHLLDEVIKDPSLNTKDALLGILNS
ncbi:MAG: CCA tRNA nucleotidyltransferase [Ruminococcaceae bacterium]|nr:CCA tRNA nucleotidyltransferase [Oscillospiraceae bacterium]